MVGNGCNGGWLGRRGDRDLEKSRGGYTRGVWVLACLPAGFDWAVWFFDFAGRRRDV